MKKFKKILLSLVMLPLLIGCNDSGLHSKIFCEYRKRDSSFYNQVCRGCESIANLDIFLNSNSSTIKIISLTSSSFPYQYNELTHCHYCLIYRI